MRTPSCTSGRASLLNVLLPVLVVAALVLPAAAAAIVVNIQGNVVSGSAYFEGYDSATETWTYAYLGASKSTETRMIGKKSTTTVQTSGWAYVDQYGPWGYRYGWAPLSGANFDGDPALTSATLRDVVEFEFWGWSNSAGYPTGLVAFDCEVIWTGTGDTYSYGDSYTWRPWGHFGNHGNHYGQSGYGKSGYVDRGNHYGQSGYGKSGYVGNGHRYGQSGYGKSGYVGLGRGPKGLSDYISELEWLESWRAAGLSGSFVDGINGYDYLVNAYWQGGELASRTYDETRLGVTPSPTK